MIVRRSLYGADYNRRTIAWCRRNIAGVEFIDNDLSPPLPLPPEQMDCVYALSVFTHLSEAMHDAWRGELARVLRPGGVLILTTHGDCFRDRNLSATEQRDYDAGRLVVRGAVREGKKFYAAFHSPQFVRNRLLAGFDLLAHVPCPRDWALEQDVWVARKRTLPASRT